LIAARTYVTVEQQEGMMSEDKSRKEEPERKEIKKEDRSTPFNDGRTDKGSTISFDKPIPPAKK
jgi:hypothetical protein